MLPLRSVWADDSFQEISLFFFLENSRAKNASLTHSQLVRSYFSRSRSLIGGDCCRDIGATSSYYEHGHTKSDIGKIGHFGTAKSSRSSSGEGGVRAKPWPLFEAPWNEECAEWRRPPVA